MTRKKIRNSLRISQSSGEPASRDSAFKYLLDHANGVAVDLDRVVDVFAIAAGHHGDNWHLAFVTLSQHVSVAFAQAVDRECEPAEFVLLVRICAREIENDFRIALEYAGQVSGERFKVLGVGSAVAQLDVECRSGFEERIV